MDTPHQTYHLAMPTRVDAAPARLAGAAATAKAAESRGDWMAAHEAWRLYRLIRDGQRDPDDLLVEGVELSALARELSRPG